MSTSWEGEPGTTHEHKRTSTEDVPLEMACGCQAEVERLREENENAVDRVSFDNIANENERLREKADQWRDLYREKRDKVARVRELVDKAAGVVHVDDLRAALEEA